MATFAPLGIIANYYLPLSGALCVEVNLGVSWSLDDGIERNRESPDTFEIPSVWKKKILNSGDLVKLIFNISILDGDDSQNEIERMWVIITKKVGDSYEGVLDNDPYSTDEIKSGIKVNFNSKHIIAIDYDANWKKLITCL